MKAIQIAECTNKSLQLLKAFIHFSLLLQAHALLDPSYHLREVLEGKETISVTSPVSANTVSTLPMPQFLLSSDHKRICAEC